ncbi:MAG TPA: FAD-linked oxidase C-terminal domain-containing protein, partial [Candidatus Lustribacter sp.]
IVDMMNGDAIVRLCDLDSHAFGTKIEMFDDALHDQEPSAIVIAGAHPKRDHLAVWGAAPPELENMRALKRRFDPKHILNPGRFVGGL